MYQDQNLCLDTYTKILKTLNIMANTSLKSLATFEGVTSGSFKDVISKCVPPPNHQTI